MYIGNPLLVLACSLHVLRLLVSVQPYVPLSFLDLPSKSDVNEKLVYLEFASTEALE
jgi:hypothetical protein